VNWQAGRQLGSYAVELKLEKVTGEKGGDAEQGTRYRKSEGVRKRAETRPAEGHNSEGRARATRSERNF